MFLPSWLTVVAGALAIVSAADTIDLSGQPGYGDLTSCSRTCLSDIGFNIGCQTNACLCRQDHLQAAFSTMTACIMGSFNGLISDCGDQQDVDTNEAIALQYCKSLGFQVTASSSAGGGATTPPPTSSSQSPPGSSTANSTSTPAPLPSSPAPSSPAPGQSIPSSSPPASSTTPPPASQALGSNPVVTGSHPGSGSRQAMLSVSTYLASLIIVMFLVG